VVVRVLTVQPLQVAQADLLPLVFRMWILLAYPEQQEKQSLQTD
jgi:hypothetical protein